MFTVADAKALEDFARSKGMGMLSMWSIQRDTRAAWVTRRRVLRVSVTRRAVSARPGTTTAP